MHHFKWHSNAPYSTVHVHTDARMINPFSVLCRVICLCAQFEAVLQHGLKKSRGLALTAAALKQAAGFSSKTEGGTVLNGLVCQILSGLTFEVESQGNNLALSSSLSSARRDLRTLILACYFESWRGCLGAVRSPHTLLHKLQRGRGVQNGRHRKVPASLFHSLCSAHLPVFKPLWWAAHLLWLCTPKKCCLDLPSS